MKKKTKGCVKSMISDADIFTCEFPPNISTVENKALLLASVIFLDFILFEDNSKKNNQDH